MRVHSNVYAQYCGYNTKMEGYTHCRYTRVVRDHEKDMTKQINIMNEVGEDIPRGLLITTSGLVNFLKSLKSFYEFDELMLPSEISITKLYTTLKFISPQIILAHGSYITKVRYLPEGSPDLDITIVSIRKEDVANVDKLRRMRGITVLSEVQEIEEVLSVKLKDVYLN